MGLWPAVRRAGLVACAPLVTLLAACASPDAEPVESLLVGAPDAPESVARSTLHLLTPGCTAAKVGDRYLLTAAHCVDGNGPAGQDPAYLPGAWIWVCARPVIDKALAGSDPEAAGYVHVQIEQTIVAPPWVGTSGLGSGSPDLAVVALTADTAAALRDATVVAIDDAPVLPGDRVILVGYGAGSAEHAADPFRRLRAGEDLVLAAPEPLPAELARTVESFFATDAGGEPRLEAGDSGGPVYRWAGAGLTLVGVNSTTLWWDRMADTHTRVDRGYEFDTAGWLEGIVAGAGPLPVPACDHPCADWNVVEGGCLQTWLCEEGCLRPLACCQYACASYGFVEGECRQGWHCQSGCLVEDGCSG
jgi:hypothetical protein